MAADALEIALALWRAPSRRTALQQRPLPRDVAGLMALAAAAPERVADASRRTGEEPKKIVEAARFYLREVLLFDGADAYRLLGVARDCSTTEIKANHRALQQWLHPDRCDGDLESLYASRINAAWSELRSPERRAAYDARQRDAAAGMPPRRVLVTGWRPVRAHNPALRRWLALAVVAGAGAWLAPIVFRQNAAPEPRWQSVIDGSFAAGARAAAEPSRDGQPQPGLDAREASAHRVGRQLLGYLAGQQSQDPQAWGSASAMQAAASIRQRLGGDGGDHGPGWRAAQFAEPMWRIRPGRATLSVDVSQFRPRDPQRLSANLAWRDGIWVVDSVAMEDAP